jgi:putative transposase
VWAPRYRKRIKNKDIKNKVKEVLREVAERDEYEIKEINVCPDHVHTFLSFPQDIRLGMRRGIETVSPYLKYLRSSRGKERFARGFWEDAYFAGTAGAE